MSKAQGYQVKQCVNCGKRMHGGPRRLYCNRACQQQAYRKRKRDSYMQPSR
jgi:hypothetical protein